MSWGKGEGYTHCPVASNASPRNGEKNVEGARILASVAPLVLCIPWVAKQPWLAGGDYLPRPGPHGQRAQGCYTCSLLAKRCHTQHT